MQEIERKFRLRGRPPSDVLGKCHEIAQGYLFTGATELRVRRKGATCFLTLKGGGSMSRSEWEIEIPTEVFTSLWPKTEGRRVEKVRYDIPYSGVVLEVDEYRGDLAGLYTLEVEFDTEVAAHEFILPKWAMDATDVTTQPGYKNQYLAINGLPSSI